MRRLLVIVVTLFVVCPAFGQADSPSSAHPAAKTIVLRPAGASAASAQRRPQALHAAADVIVKRLHKIGVASPAVAVDEARGSLAVTIPANRSADELHDLLTRPGRLEFRYLPQLGSAWHTAPEVVNGKVTLFERILGRDGRPVSRAELTAALSRKAPFTGADLLPTWRAESIPAHPPSGRLARVGVLFEFKPTVKDRFESSTAQHIGQTLAIFLDGRLLSAPTIVQPIPGEGIISAQWDMRQARDMAAQLNSGPLPVPLEVVR